MTRLMAALAVGALALVGCGSDETADLEPTAAGAIRVTEAWARPSPGGGTTTAIYFTMTNEGTDLETLLAADAASCATTELHMSVIDEEGVMRMSPLADGIVVPPESSVVLGPGGLHLMCLGVAEPLEEGELTEVTLRFATAGTVTATAEVRTDQ